MKKIMWCVGVMAQVVFAGESVFEVTDQVLRKDPPRFGTNFELPVFTAWNERMNNIWNSQYSFEPIVFRHNSQATGGGEDFIDDVKGAPRATENGQDIKSPGCGYWYVMYDGFWDGADVTIFRETQDGVKQIRTSKVKSFQSPSREKKGGEEKIVLADKGEPVQKGDLYVLDMKHLAVPDGVANPEKLRNGLFAPTPKSGVTWSLDDQTHCPEGGSTASMKIQLPGNDKDVVGMEDQFIRNTGSSLDVRQRSGKEYVCDIWMKQSGLDDQDIVLQFGPCGTEKAKVSNEWKKYTFKVPNIGNHVPKGVQKFLIGAQGQGTLWIDNLAIYEKDLPPFAIFPEWTQAVKEYKSGPIRTMAGKYLLTVDNLLTEGFERNPIWDDGKGISAGSIGLNMFLRFCEATGGDPYVILHVLPTDEEIRHLMEYLGAPAEVGYGQLRARQGRKEPWVQAFKNIYIECGNECWNRGFAPQAWPEQPVLFGKVSDRLFAAMKSSKWNTRKNLRFMGGAFVNNLYRWKDKKTGQYQMEDQAKGWTFRVAETCKSMDILATAPSGYLGGWDGDAVIGANDDDLFAYNLLYSARIMESKLADLLAMKDELQKSQGRTFEMLKYEAGPGYLLPNPEKPIIADEEKVGKSLALGTATLDNFMFVLANGGNANFFQTRTGAKWASHAKDMTPHTAWLALMLRNVYCSGDLMKVNEKTVAKMDLPEVEVKTLTTQGKKISKKYEAMPDVPLVRFYAFRDGKKNCCLVLNRSFTESQTVTIQLPYKPSAKATTYMLSQKNPRATNNEQYAVKIVETKVDTFSNDWKLVIPPASSCVVLIHSLD